MGDIISGKKRVAVQMEGNKMRYLIIDETDIVVNACEWDGKAVWSPPAGHRIIRSDEVPIGAVWDGAKWTGLPEPEQPVAPLQTAPPDV
jgi:hypothetical protein